MQLLEFKHTGTLSKVNAQLAVDCLNVSHIFMQSHYLQSLNWRRQEVDTSTTGHCHLHYVAF